MRATKSERRGRRLAASLAVTVLILAGCGSSDEAGDDGAAEEVDEGADEAASDAAADEQQEDPAEEPADEQQDEDDASPGAELPDSFPEDLVPLPSSATITSTYQVDSGDAIAYSASFTSTDSADEVVEHFDDELDGDWKQLMKSSADGGEFVVYAKEEDGTGDQVTITVTSSNGTTEGLVQVILYK